MDGYREGQGLSALAEVRMLPAWMRSRIRIGGSMKVVNVQICACVLASMGGLAGCSATAQEGGDALQAPASMSAERGGSDGVLACVGDHRITAGSPPTTRTVLRFMNDNDGSGIAIDRLVAYAEDGAVLCDSSAQPGTPEFTSLPAALAPHAIGSWTSNEPCMNGSPALGPHGHARFHLYWSHSGSVHGFRNPLAAVSIAITNDPLLRDNWVCTPIQVRPGR
jgi:hypothetical protein